MNLNDLLLALSSDGKAGPQGEKGDLGPAGSSCSVVKVSDTATITCEDGTSATVSDGAQGPKGDTGEQGSAGEGQAVNLIINPILFPGLAAQDFAALFPDSVNNTARLVIDGKCDGEVIVINGPAIETQIVEGFGTDGKPLDVAGLSQELPFVFEVNPASTPSGPDTPCSDAELRSWFDSFSTLEDKRDMFLIVTGSTGSEVFRFKFFNFAPDNYTDGVVGTRFTFVQSAQPDHTEDIERDPAATSLSVSYNPAADKFVEIEGLGITAPLVVEQSARSLTLELSFGDGSLWSWVRETIKKGGSDVKRSLSLISKDETGSVELERTNYYGCIVKKYEQFKGFRQVEQIAERVILSCDFSEAA